MSCWKCVRSAALPAGSGVSDFKKHRRTIELARGDERLELLEQHPIFLDTPLSLRDKSVREIRHDSLLRSRPRPLGRHSNDVGPVARRVAEERVLPSVAIRGALTVTPTTTPACGLFELTRSAKSWSWMWRYGLKSPASGMGRSSSRSHHTISEHVRGSGAMMRSGSASTRHSQIDQRCGRKEEKARRGDEGGRAARICD